MVGNSGPLRAPLIIGATAGVSQPIDASAYTNLTFYVKTNGSPSAGTVILEEADWKPLAEQPTSLSWSEIATVTVMSDVGDSAQYAYHVGGPGGSFSFAFVRARIGTTIVGTTVDVVLRAV